ncbi:MAG: hypothetical protein WD491_05635 [Balneolales bacterium]
MKLFYTVLAFIVLISSTSIPANAQSEASSQDIQQIKENTFHKTGGMYMSRVNEVTASVSHKLAQRVHYKWNEEDWETTSQTEINYNE